MTAEQAASTRAEILRESIKRSAERHQVSVNTIRRAIASGEIPAYRAGRIVRLDPADVDAWMAPVANGFSR